VHLVFFFAVGLDSLNAIKPQIINLMMTAVLSECANHSNMDLQAQEESLIMSESFVDC
jgi:hypothetical protein